MPVKEEEDKLYTSITRLASKEIFSPSKKYIGK